MAKDDYHVIVYQILAYLYQCLKKDERVDTKNLQNNNKFFQINENYWAYILVNMQDMGLIEGVGFLDVDQRPYPIPIKLDDCRITPAGIEYLCDNSFMEKAKRFLKEVKEIVPFT